MRKVLLLFLFFCAHIFAQEFNYLPSVKEGNIIKHTYYTLSFVDKYKQAEWVAYKLTSDMIISESERNNKFKPDPLVETGTAVDIDYKNTGYDKGHLCPAADMSWNQEAMNETFYYSNISPQLPGFNRGIWKKLEEKVREWAHKEKTIYIVTGGVLNDSLKTIGVKNSVAVPVLFYKIILDVEEPEKKGIAFIFANQFSDDPLSEYAVSIDSVEALTHINFFPQLPEKLEKKIERNYDLTKWGLDYNTDNAPEEIKEKQCKAITSKNQQCKRKALPGSDYCRQHSVK